jgi:hypothetical protein
VAQPLQAEAHLRPQLGYGHILFRLDLEIGFVVRRLQTGMELRMKESHRKGIANHPDPESCVARRKAAIEA